MVHPLYGILLILFRYLRDLLPYLAIWRFRRDLITRLSILIYKRLSPSIEKVRNHSHPHLGSYDVVPVLLGLLYLPRSDLHAGGVCSGLTSTGNVCFLAQVVDVIIPRSNTKFQE